MVEAVVREHTLSGGVKALSIRFIDHQAIRGRASGTSVLGGYR